MSWILLTKRIAIERTDPLQEPINGMNFGASPETKTHDAVAGIGRMFLLDCLCVVLRGLVIVGNV